MKSIYYKLIALLFYLFRVFPIKKNKIVISSYWGQGYGDNGKYIAEELLKRNHQYEIVWLTTDMSNVFPNKIRKATYRSLKGIYEQCTAKIWIDNRRKPLYVRKRKEQVYIMTWHGYMGIKKLEQDVEDKLDDLYVKAAKRDSEMIDYFIAGSRWEAECISRAFWYNGTVLKYGYPRSDILLSGIKNDKVRKRYELDSQDKIILYAPTFRRSFDENSLSVYDLPWNDILMAFSKKFGGHWVGMIRLHPNLYACSDRLHVPDHVINVTEYDDMQELIAECDCLITDYSSTIMDAGIAGKVGFLYAADYLSYQMDRNFYFDIQNDLPFPFSDNTGKLLNNIETFAFDSYNIKIKEFFDDRYGVYRSGKASKLVGDLIEKIIFVN